MVKLVNTRDLKSLTVRFVGSIPTGCTICLTKFLENKVYIIRLYYSDFSCIACGPEGLLIFFSRQEAEEACIFYRSIAEKKVELYDGVNKKDPI